MSNNNRKSAARKPNLKAQTAAMSTARNAAFVAGTSRGEVMVAARAAVGNRPNEALYGLLKSELTLGYMASALARQGDNRGRDDIVAHCRERLERYVGFGKAVGNKAGARTEGEERAYSSARVQVTNLLKDAGIENPKPKAARKPRQTVAKAPKALNAAEARKATPKVNDAETAMAFLRNEAARLRAFHDKNVKALPLPIRTLLSDFASAVKAFKVPAAS